MSIAVCSPTRFISVRPILDRPVPLCEKHQLLLVLPEAACIIHEQTSIAMGRIVRAHWCERVLTGDDDSRSGGFNFRIPLTDLHFQSSISELHFQPGWG